MSDTKGIHRLVMRTRRRLRLQAAVDAGAFAAVPVTFAAALVLLTTRLQFLPAAAGAWMVALLCLVPFVLAAVQTFRAYPTHVVATRIDRASGLDDRLASACDFAERLHKQPAVEAETAELMRAAILDAQAVLAKADVKKAAPWSRPRALYPALGGVAVFVLISLWDFPAMSSSALPRPRATTADRTPEQVELDPADIEYQKGVIEDMKKIAQQTGDKELEAFAKELEAIVDQAQKGLLSKQEMLAKLAEAEKAYQSDSDSELDHTLGELKKTGNELAKNPVLKDLAQALTQSDMAKAQAEFDKLAQKLDAKQLKAEDQKKIAESLDKAADDFEKRQKTETEESKQARESKQDEIKRLEDKLAKASDKEKERLSQELQRKKKELEKLDKDQEKKNESATRRHLEELHRDLKNAADELKKSDSDPSRQASRAMRDIQRSTGKIEQDQRKVANQKRVASQLSDLREAMRRAKRKQGGGQPDNFGKKSKEQDYASRAGGQKSGGSSQKTGTQPGGSGQKPGGSGYGDEPGSGLYGDATQKTGNTKDVDVQGLQTEAGTSVKETVLSAAQKGFAGQSYKRVYASYEPKVEEVINSEKVPSGYKYYVKRYFQKIKPQE